MKQGQKTVQKGPKGAKKGMKWFKKVQKLSNETPQKCPHEPYFCKRTHRALALKFV